MGKRNLLYRLALAGALSALWAASPAQVAAGPITPEIDQLVLWAGSDISLGSYVTLDAAAAAGQNFVAAPGALLESIYAAGDIDLGMNATVRGRVLGNGVGFAAKGLDLAGYWTSQSVTVGMKAVIVGDVTAATGFITIDRKADITGNILGNSDISIDKNSTVVGDARPGLTGTLTLGRKTTVTGSTEPGVVTADTFLPPSMGDRPDAGEVGSLEIRPADGTTTILDPGAYSDVVLGASSTLGLSAGTYTVQSFSIGDGGTVNVDTSAGTVVLNVQGDLVAASSVQFATTGMGGLLINVFDNDVGFGDNAVVDAAIRVWGGSFATGANSALTGSYHATDSVSLGDGSSAQSGSLPVPVTEPAALSVIAMGAILALHKRKKRLAGGAPSKE